MTHAGNHFLPRIPHPLPKRKVKKLEKSNICGPYIPYGLFQTKGEMCANVWFKNVNLYKVQTNTLSALNIR
jgi:hypothetical protein